MLFPFLKERVIRSLNILKVCVSKRDCPFSSLFFFTDIGQRCPFRTPVFLRVQLFGVKVVRVFGTT
jgi:hypothetical protein